ncbi:hypothetical protein ACVI1K_005000 [Bradyrhizobium sp. USDA 4508]
MTVDRQVYNPCPKCGAELEMGFGLAGGGFGPYEYCSNITCDQFTKWPEPVEDSNDGGAPEDRRPFR